MRSHNDLEISRALDTLDINKINAAIQRIEEKDFKSKMIRAYPFIRDCISDRNKLAELKEEEKRLHIRERDHVSSLLKVLQDNAIIDAFMKQLPLGLTEWNVHFSSKEKFTKILKIYFSNTKEHYWLHMSQIEDWCKQHSIEKSDALAFLDTLVTQHVLIKEVYEACEDDVEAIDDDVYMGDHPKEIEIKYRYGSLIDVWVNGDITV